MWNSVYSVVRKKYEYTKKEERTSFCCLILSLKRAENEARTRDPNLGKVMLYQLSYFRNKLVKEMRLELTRHNCHYPLKVARLPIPPFLQFGFSSYFFIRAQNKTRTCTSLNTRT